MLRKIIRFFLENRLVVALLLIASVLWGIATSPFSLPDNFLLSNVPKDPVAVDAIPDLGENQQIIYTEWAGRSPQDIEDQISYPLTSALLGIPGIKTVRSNSIFGLSSIYLIFEDDIEFYWSRSRILEKLNSLPAGTLPEGVQPSLGPDATGLGQIFWYTLEGRDPETGEPRGGWDPQELRSIQDYYVGYALASAQGVAEVAAVGGFVKEYQVDVDPIAMKEYDVTINEVMTAVQESNLDVGARTIEFNRVEYVVRGLGYIRSIKDLEESVVTVRDNTPIRIKDVARVNFGPANRRGGLDKEGVEATGAVVVARYDTNPLEVIDAVKAKIKEIEPGLPEKTLANGLVSKVTIVPFYDRSGLIQETIGTLATALEHEILISIIVVLFLIVNVRASLIISGLLPIAVLITFIIMRYLGVDANIVALSGIAIAIGVMVDVGIVLTENILRHLSLPENQNAQGEKLVDIITDATTEVASAVITALATTVISFLPVFAMQGAEGKMFTPLALTKTFALLATILLGLLILPTLAYWVYSLNLKKRRVGLILGASLVAIGLLMLVSSGVWLYLAIIMLGVNQISRPFYPQFKFDIYKILNLALILFPVIWVLTDQWLPLGPEKSTILNMLFVIFSIGIIVGALFLIMHYYTQILSSCLENKKVFLLLPLTIIIIGLFVWMGASKVLLPVYRLADLVGIQLNDTKMARLMDETFPGLGKEFMPTLDEGSFLLMPTSMAHSGVEENIDVIRLMDQYVASIPEVETVVGKWGRVNSALDPAPISMFENVINYKSEYLLNPEGRRQRFKVDRNGAFMLSNGSRYDPDIEGFQTIDTELLVPDRGGRYYRQWRPEIKTRDDIWKQIVSATNIPGVTSAPKLQPIETRLVMLSTGMRAPMGIKVYGPNLESIESFGLELEKILKSVPGVKKSAVFADRIVGKPYLEFEIDRFEIARYGLSVADFQRAAETAIGGVQLSTSVEGRERFPIRVRYAREFRDNPSDIKKVLIPTPSGAQVPLEELAEITYRRGAQMIKSEDTFLVGYVIFDHEDGRAPVDLVEQADRSITNRIAEGSLIVPDGVSYRFTGEYEQQVSANKRLGILLPVSLLIIFLLLYFQFREIALTLMVFTGVFVAFGGGFFLLWLYNQPGFLDLTVFGSNLREVFNIGPVNLSVAVWVGFIALFGVATDDGVLMGTYLKQVFKANNTVETHDVKSLVIEAGKKRVRPAVMTTATTLIALLPVLAATGKGSEIMIPMAIPLFGGMLFQAMTMFVVPVLYALWTERVIKRS